MQLKGTYTDSNKRSILAKKNAVYLLLLKGGSILISLVYVPLLLNSLNSSEYAVWLTLTSIVGWLVVTDIGIGNGLRNKLAEHLAKGNISICKEYVSTAYFCIAVILAAIIAVFLLVSHWLNWPKILNATNIDAIELNYLVIIVFICYCIQFGLSLINSVLLALQKPAVSSLIGFLGQFISFIIILILVKSFGVQSLLVVGTTISIIPIFVYLMANIFFFTRRKDLAPGWSRINISLMRDIWSLGIKFFILQIIGIVLFYSNNIIIMHAIDNNAVVKYNVSYKYMHCIYMLFTIIATPIWSATTDAFTKGDITWIKNTNKRLLQLVGLLCMLGIVMWGLAPYIFRLWLGKDGYYNTSTLGLLLLYFIFFSLYGCYGFILNGMGKLKLQIYITSILAIAYIPIAYYCGSWLGLNGVLLVFLINQMVNACWSGIQYKKIITNRATGIWNA